MKVIDGKGATLGRIASLVAKEALKGEEISVINCDNVIITGNFSAIKENFEIKRGRVGSGQKGPKHPATSEKIVKRAVRGMLPNHRAGRGKAALGRVKCYAKTPKEFENSKTEKIGLTKKIKFSEVKEFVK